jgi:hypothetical protein
MLVPIRSVAAMARFVDKQHLMRANAVLMRGMVVGGMVSCALAASLYDLGVWFRVW